MRWLPATADSAYFRARYPRSYWWTPQTDLLALILQAVQGANWQRAGGKGKAPELLKRPSDTPPISVHTVEELAERRARQNAELARRRRQHNAGKGK